MKLEASDHAYYCETGNYYKNGQHTRYGSWASFADAWGSLDDDLNTVFRWDIKAPGCPELEGCLGCEDCQGPDHHVLTIHWVLQRKAILRSTECPVTAEDMPAVTAFLTRKAEYMRDLWSPLV